MLLGLDHIVIAVNDLDTAMKDYQRLGFTVVPGGRHPVGTYNGLIAFADRSYIELISFYRDNPDHRWWVALKQGEGLIDFCMQTDDLRGDTEKFRRAGVEMDDPVPWSRTRPDGYELKWRLALARGRDRGVAPFLIEDVTPRDERVPRDVEHSNGANGIAAVLVAIDDLPVVASWYHAVLGSGGEKVERDEMKAKGVAFAIGAQRLELLAAVDDSSAVAARLRERGPSPLAAILHSNKKAPPADAKLTHGAALRFA
jgi:Glyoxalase-like domain